MNTLQTGRGVAALVTTGLRRTGRRPNATHRARPFKRDDDARCVVTTVDDDDDDDTGLNDQTPDPRPAANTNTGTGTRGGSTRPQPRRARSAT